MSWSAASSAKMAQYFSKLSPVPAFPEYTGPYKVGTVDVEIPVEDLGSPSPAPSNAADISTIQFRVFYPAVDEPREKRIWWLPNPQRHHVSAYTRFLGVGNTMADLLSFLPRHLNYTAIPAHKNATMREPNTDNGRWPTMIFSHGLGGSRNSYSYIAGSLASHGVVVFCPEHRDGSSVLTLIRNPDENHTSRTSRLVSYQKISHTVSPEVYEQREAQLRIRLWELGLLHDAMLAMDLNFSFRNLNATTPSLREFAGRLAVHEPGSIIFAGHSFGAATVNQFLKSTYYAGDADVAAMAQPLFQPTARSEIRRQVTARTVTMLLDMWCLPLMAPNSAPLLRRPLPAYDDVPTAAGGAALLAVESESFVKWTEHFHMTARALSPDPSASTVSPTAYERPSGVRLPEPNFFYVERSAHLNQSDFGILFPWLTKKIFDADQPERALRLNLRAQLQILRTNGVPVARTAPADLVDGSDVDKLHVEATGGAAAGGGGLNDDAAIFDRSGNTVVSHWHWLDTIGLGQPTDSEGNQADTSAEQQVEESDWKVKGELEPSDAAPASPGSLSQSVSRASRTIHSITQTS